MVDRPEKGRHLDLSCGPDIGTAQPASSTEGEPPGETADAERRRFVGVEFECCSVYTRVYINAQGSAYEGNCPRCGRPVRLRIGPGGTTERFFRVS